MLHWLLFKSVCAQQSVQRCACAHVSMYWTTPSIWSSSRWARFLLPPQSSRTWKYFCGWQIKSSEHISGYVQLSKVFLHTVDVCVSYRSLMSAWACVCVCVCVCVESLPIPHSKRSSKLQVSEKKERKGGERGGRRGGRELTKRPSALHHVSCWQSTDTPLLPAWDQWGQAGDDSQATPTAVKAEIDRLEIWPAAQEH